MSKSTLVCIAVIAAIVIAVTAGAVISIIGNNSPDRSVFGNTPTNISNGGMVTETDCGTAYSNNGIYIKPDGGEAYELTNDRAEALSFGGGYIYYCNQSDNNRCYRIDMQGNSQKLTDFSVEYINIVDDDIYFLCNKEIENFGIYKMGLEGQGLEKLSDVYASCLLVYKNRLYYADKDRGGALCMMDADGKNVRVIYDRPAACPVFCEANMRLYFAGKEGIYRCRADGSALEQMSDIPATGIAIDGETLFYSCFSYSGEVTSGIVRSDIALDKYNRIRGDEVMYLGIGGGQLYFKSMSQSFSVMRTDFNGENGVFAAGGETVGLIENAG